MFDWRWDFVWEILPRLLQATGNTLIAAIAGYGIALVLGLFLALGQRTPYRIVTLVIREFVEFIRSTPLLLQIFFIFYVGPQFGVRLSPWMSGMIAIGLHYACYLSEVYRGGIESVPRGQHCKNIAALSFHRPSRLLWPEWAIIWWVSSRTRRCFRSLVLLNSFILPMPSGQRTIVSSNPTRWSG